MGTATGLVTLVDGTTIEVADLNLNFTTLTNSVNNIVSAQITDGTIVNGDISSSAEIAMSKITATASDAALSAAMASFMRGCWIGNATDGSTINVDAGEVMINGELRKNTSATDTDPGTDPDAADWLDVWLLADTTASTFTVSLVDSGTSPGGSSNPGTNGRMIGSVYHKGSGVYSKIINYRPDGIYGWSWNKATAASSMNKTITHGKTFDEVPVCVIVKSNGGSAAEPVTLDDLTTASSVAMNVESDTITTTNFKVYWETESGETLVANRYYAVSYFIPGNYS